MEKVKQELVGKVVKGIENENDAIDRTINQLTLAFDIFDKQNYL